MTIAKQVGCYLNQQAMNFELIEHGKTECTMESARQAHVSPRQMAKAVVLEDDQGFMMAVMPASQRLMLSWLNTRLDRHLRLVPESLLGELFPDCDVGAVPAIGAAYHVPMCWDDSLEEVSDIYFEAGNHRELVHLDKDDYLRLVQQQPHGRISCSEEERDAFLY